MISETNGASVASPWQRVAMWSIAAITFALAYGTFPLYEGNYNTYLLHGFASAERGQLKYDWQAQTLDPFPVFSALVTIPAALNWRWFFYVGHALLLGAYLFAIVQLATSGHPQKRATSTVVVASILVVPQVWLGRDAISYVFDGDWGWYLQAGVAMQYLAGHMFQPSLFGVFCVVSLAAFASRWDRSALVFAATAALVHFSYSITALGLSAGYSLARWRDGRDTRSALRYMALGLILCAAACLPILRFVPTDEATAAAAARILADVRVPHHADPSRWLAQPGIFGIQTPLLVGGAAIAWRTRLRWPYLMVLGLGVTLSATQVLSGSRQLALLFPWRVSTVLVPVAFSLIIGALCYPHSARFRSPYVMAASVIVALLAAAYGYWHTQKELRAYDRDPIRPMLQAATGIATPRALFAVPTNMERFRLETGARTFVDFKVHPYRDVEVVEWYERLLLAHELDSDDSSQACRTVQTLHVRYGVTHFVRPSDRPLPCGQLAAEYEDEAFIIQKWL
jgi:hypothetical protein